MRFMGSDARGLSTIRRREERQAVEMFAHFRHGATRITVILRDLTCLGARIEGVPSLSADEAVSLALPGRKPALAFVAWSNEHCAGLEFAEPMAPGLLESLVSQFAVGTIPASQARPVPSPAFNALAA
jgi:hypothetical protein